jgi:integrase
VTTSPLKLFAPENPTLHALYVEKWQSLRARRTVGTDLEGLRWWEKLTGGVSACNITAETCRVFRRALDELIKLGKFGPNHGNKLVRSVNRFLKLLGPNDGSVDPEDPSELQFVGLVSGRLQIKPPKVVRKEVDGWMEIEEMEAFLAACPRAKWVNFKTARPLSRTPGIDPPVWWRATWILAYNTALRVEELLACRWDWMESDKHGTWLRLPKEAAKTGVERMVYLNSKALESLEVLRRCGGETWLNWPYTHSWLDRLRMRIYEHAELRRCMRLKIGWHGLRKACATALTALAGADIAAMHLGHSLKGVTAKHYLHRSAVCNHVEALPQPRILEAEDRQLRLF